MDIKTKNLTMATVNDIAYQKDLLPIEAIQIFDNTNGSADLKLIVTASNNKDYAVKTVLDGNSFIPATELFCYELARLIGVPTPNYDLITMRDGSLAFGSVWEGGVHHIDNLNNIIEVLTGQVSVRDLNQFFSRVYAFDLFVNNLDRHFGNYLFRQSYNSLIGLAFDYSRAWYEVGAYSYEALDNKESKTQKCHELIKEYKKYDRNVAINTLTKIESISKLDLEKILQTIPDEWLSSDLKNEIANWWGTEDMKHRLTKLKGVI